MSLYALCVTISLHVSMVTMDAPADMLWVRHCCSNTRMHACGVHTKSGMTSSEHYMMMWWHKWSCMTSSGHHIVTCQWWGWCLDKRDIKRSRNWVFLSACFTSSLGSIQLTLVPGSKFRLQGEYGSCPMVLGYLSVSRHWVHQEYSTT